MVDYLSIEQILLLHELQMDRFGGSRGLRDRGGLESAAARPAMTFGGEDLYPDIAAKAAALMHSIVVNHPFVDGDKRVGISAAELFLELNGVRMGARDKDLEELTLSVARAELDAESLAIWFRQRLERAE
ncbi:MAG TPA: type II toxin-antitoxin system death-on-curing family toxin [Thermoanaerobaculia bacterium]|nr:type II toxin-antitoxin system death-on-curing family toxin [Thermoanaerobaculia bacterium]